MPCFRCTGDEKTSTVGEEIHLCYLDPVMEGVVGRVNQRVHLGSAFISAVRGTAHNPRVGKVQVSPSHPPDFNSSLYPTNDMECLKPDHMVQTGMSLSQ